MCSSRTHQVEKKSNRNYIYVSTSIHMYEAKKKSLTWRQCVHVMKVYGKFWSNRIPKKIKLLRPKYYVHTINDNIVSISKVLVLKYSVFFSIFFSFFVSTVYAATTFFSRSYVVFRANFEIAVLLFHFILIFFFGLRFADHPGYTCMPSSKRRIELMKKSK